MIVKIDPNICKQHKLSIAEAMYIGSLYFELEQEVDKQNLHKHDFINIDEINNTIKITQRGVNTFENIISESNKNKSTSHTKELQEAAEEMRLLFPKGFKKDDNGNPKWPWRCSVSEAVERLEKLEALYSCELNKDELIKATKLYIKINENNSLMRTLPYFIIKEGRSDLNNFICMVQDGENDEDINIQDDSQYEIRFDE